MYLSNILTTYFFTLMAALKKNKTLKKYVKN